MSAKKTLRVLQLGKHYPFGGGIEKFYFDLSKELNKNGISSAIFCASQSSSNLACQKDGVFIFCYGRFAFFASTSLSFKIFSYLKNILPDYDLLHLHLPDPMVVIALFFVRPRQPIIIHWHSDIVKQKFLKKLFFPLQKWILRRSQHIIVTSPQYLETSIDLQPYKHKCSIMPLGFNPERLMIDPDLLMQLKERYKDRTIIFSLGRATAYKGFEYLMASASYLPDHYLVLIGGNMDKKFESTHQGDKVILLGYIDDRSLGSYYALADLFVLPSVSRNEAFGLVQCEAMYFSKPVVSTNIQGSGVSFVNQDNQTGRIVPIKNPQALAKACIEILENPTTYQQYAKAAKKRASQLCDIQHVTKKIISLYKRLH